MLKTFDEFLVSVKKLKGSASWDRFSCNVVAVVVIENHDVLVAAEGCVRKLTCLICVDLAGDWFTCWVDVVSSNVVRFLE